jgi:hypothetical protein
MTREKEYRAFVIGKNGHFTGLKEFTAANDEAAVDRARQMIDGADLELWQLDRFVTRLSAQSRDGDRSSQ